MNLNFDSRITIDIVDVIRSCLENLDFADDPMAEGSNRLAWTFFCTSVIFESDEMYKIIQSNEGERIYPQEPSLCQLLLDVFGSDIKKNLNVDIIQRIWKWSDSLLLLKWFMSSTNSEALTIHRDTGWSPIFVLLRDFDNSISYWPYSMKNFTHEDAYLYLPKEKIKFLVEKGASLHYTEDGVSLTTIAMRYARTFYLWCELLQELEIDIQGFLEEEPEQRPLGDRVWSKTTTLAFFQESMRNKPRIGIFGWDFKYYSCSRCDSDIPSFWKFYLDSFEYDFSDFDNRTNDKADDHGRLKFAGQTSVEESGDNDDVFQNDEIDNDDDAAKVEKDDEAENDKEVDNSEELDNGVETDDDDVEDVEDGDDEDVTLADKLRKIYFQKYRIGLYYGSLCNKCLCDSCQEETQLLNDMQSLTSSMPGSFDAS